MEKVIADNESKETPFIIEPTLLHEVEQATKILRKQIKDKREDEQRRELEAKREAVKERFLIALVDYLENNDPVTGALVVELYNKRNEYNMARCHEAHLKQIKEPEDFTFKASVGDLRDLLFALVLHSGKALD